MTTTLDEEVEGHEDAAQLALALGHPLRLWILARLAEEECCVGDVVCRCPADQATVSRHLAVLRSAGLVTRETRGRKRIYRLRSHAPTVRLLADLGRLATAR
ncbi:MAG: winged helix-turn-helix transcriptional regulator [Myxococcales bacterium]|nr:winged helix-turn-helix transcriptional regulator [Myxococcales bacterium]